MPYTLTWRNGDPCESQSGLYLMAVEDSSGCVTTAIAEVEVWPALDVLVDINHAFEGANGSILLIIEGGIEPYSVEWSDGGTGNPYENLGQGSYQCTITDSAGCMATIGLCYVIDTSVEDLSTAQDWILYPNPFNDYVKMQVVSGPFNSEIKIYTTLGELVMKSIFQGNTCILNTQDWPCGMYVATCNGKYVLMVKR